MKRQTIVLTVLMTLFGAPVATAGILLDIHNTSIPAGGVGFVDVTMTVEDETTLFYYSLNFHINEPYPSSDSSLVFVEHDLDYASTMSPDYVFLNASGNLAGDAGNFGLPSLDWLVSDFADPSVVTLYADTTYLLARLKVQHSYNMADIDPSGHVFTVSLVSDPNTVFQDETFNTIAHGPSSANGFVTVPEPGSLLMLSGLAACAALLLYRLRAR